MKLRFLILLLSLQFSFSASDPDSDSDNDSTYLSMFIDLLKKEGTKKISKGITSGVAESLNKLASETVFELGRYGISKGLDAYNWTYNKISNWWSGNKTPALNQPPIEYFVADIVSKLKDELSEKQEELALLERKKQKKTADVDEDDPTSKKRHSDYLNNVYIPKKRQLQKDIKSLEDDISVYLKLLSKIDKDQSEENGKNNQGDTEED